VWAPGGRGEGLGYFSLKAKSPKTLFVVVVCLFVCLIDWLID